METQLYYKHKVISETGRNRHSLMAVIDKKHYWLISWVSDPIGLRVQEPYGIETGMINDNQTPDWHKIAEDEIDQFPGADAEFISWALSGYRNYLMRTLGLIRIRPRKLT